MGLAIYSDDCSDRWEKIAAMVPGKEAGDMEPHYVDLVDDVNAIESGCVPLPHYSDSSCDSINFCFPGPGQQCRKGVPWSEEEHRLFLLGLEKHGRGDWKSISRNFVLSRTPGQVASHAQKYFKRLNTPTENKKRASIHDITSPGQGGLLSVEVPITGRASPVATKSYSNQRWKRPPPSTEAVDLSTFVLPSIVQSFDCAFMSTTPGMPPVLPSPSEIFYAAEDLNPGLPYLTDPTPGMPPELQSSAELVYDGEYLNPGLLIMSDPAPGMLTQLPPSAEIVYDDEGLNRGLPSLSDPAPGIPPELPSSAGIVYDADDLNPGLLFLSDPMNPALIDYLEPGFSDHIF